MCFPSFEILNIRLRGREFNSITTWNAYTNTNTKHIAFIINVRLMVLGQTIVTHINATHLHAHIHLANDGNICRLPSNYLFIYTAYSLGVFFYSSFFSKNGLVFILHACFNKQQFSAIYVINRTQMSASTFFLISLEIWHIFLTFSLELLTKAIWKWQIKRSMLFMAVHFYVMPCSFAKRAK